MKETRLFMSDLTGEVYSAEKSNKKSILNFPHIMILFLRFHKGVFSLGKWKVTLEEMKE